VQATKATPYLFLRGSFIERTDVLLKKKRRERRGYEQKVTKKIEGWAAQRGAGERMYSSVPEGNQQEHPGKKRDLLFAPDFREPKSEETEKKQHFN